VLQLAGLNFEAPLVLRHTLSDILPKLKLLPNYTTYQPPCQQFEKIFYDFVTILFLPLFFAI
jgi:hypothetical protein